MTRSTLPQVAGLGQRPRVAVEHVAALGLGGGDDRSDDGVGEVVGDQVPALQERDQPPAQLAAGPGLGPEDRAARQVGDPELGGDAVALGALARPRRP